MEKPSFSTQPSPVTPQEKNQRRRGQTVGRVRSEICHPLLPPPGTPLLLGTASFRSRFSPFSSYFPTCPPILIPVCCNSPTRAPVQVWMPRSSQPQRMLQTGRGWHAHPEEMPVPLSVPPREGVWEPRGRRHPLPAVPHPEPPSPSLPIHANVFMNSFRKFSLCSSGCCL